MQIEKIGQNGQNVQNEQNGQIEQIGQIQPVTNSHFKTTFSKILLNLYSF